MANFTLRNTDPERDFGQLSAWFNLLEEDSEDEQGLKDYYARRKDLITVRVAEDDQGTLLGFSWLFHISQDLRQLDLYIRPESRRQGVGTSLYAGAEQTALASSAKMIQVNVQDTDPGSRAFVEKRGYKELFHLVPMTLDLTRFDDHKYDPIIEQLKGEGFRFTSMEEQGNTEEAQRRLYMLNDSTDADVPGRNGEHSWSSFEDFRARVCSQPWFKPAGQMVVIDASGEWVAMSAISRFQNHAYNLHTGVDRRYRGRKLAQAVKIHALRYAREVLKVEAVFTHHNTWNQPMIAIDVKFGYTPQPGIFKMRKVL
jgi:RimJ/RimL family protein N-acetyltransferase